MAASTGGRREQNGSYPLDGLDAGAEILVDRWGIPHIYAGSARDAWFAQGFNIARDRLWQLDLWRRAGLGRLAEVLGRDYVERDRAARLFLYRGEIEAEWGAYGCDLRGVLLPFVEGINAYLARVEDGLESLPPEFERLGYRPQSWAAEDVLRIRAHGHYRNLRSEVARARMLHRFGPAAEELRVVLDPPQEVVVPEGLDLSLLEEDVLRAYDLATGPPLARDAAPQPAAEGSNNWVIGGGRTASGRPILANDPHRVLPLPSLRYLVHVSCPEFAFAGGAEPMLPGISFGHNGEAAFGLTVLPIDQEDLYVYELDEIGGRHYRYDGRWEEVEVERERIAVRGGEAVEVELRHTRHGPVVHEAADRPAAAAVRAAWLEPGMVPYLGGLALLEAKGWEAFRTATASWGGPGENLIYADQGGDIGWQAAGRVPRRPNWNGLLPVPGDGRFEWAGFVSAQELSYELNPRQEWLATANQRNLAPGIAASVALEWEPPFRHQRISAVLADQRQATIDGSERLQSDYLCLPAQRAIALLEGCTGSDPRAVRALAMLRGWDARLTADSASAALFETWFRKHLRRSLITGALADALPEAEVEAAVEALIEDRSTIHDARIDLRLLGIAAEDSDSLAAVVEPSLISAFEELSETLGDDPSSWRWGSLHEAYFDHPIQAADGNFESLGPLPRGGSCDTVGNTEYEAGSYRQAVGASARIVIDVGEWDRSLVLNAPGQSGDPRSPHFSSMLDRWARDESVPFLFSRAAVEEASGCQYRIDKDGSATRL